ncbi:MAG: helix-turn-helix transcriptional regulator [Lachnospiraceae bacterium]
MKTELINKRIMFAVVALAFFNFVFLGAEYMYDNMMAYVTNAKGVVAAESYILGASCIGFFLYPFLNKILKKSSKNIMAFAGAVVSIICVFVVWQHGSYALILFFGCTLFIILGIFGSAIHYIMSIMIDNKKHFAKYIGLAYALGILLQFINNNLVWNDMAESIILSLSLAVFVILLIKLRDDMESDVFKEEGISGKSVNKGYILKNPIIAGGTLVLSVMLMSCIFSTLNISVTLVHADGGADIGQWPRLLLALSGLAAGFLFDIRERKYMNMMMYCVTLLSTICVIIIEMGGPFLVGLMVFYLSAGFFVVFFSTAFMELSYHMSIPQLWAGFGRAVNNACAILTGALSVILLSDGGMKLMITALVLFTLISVVLFIYSSQFNVCKEERKEVNDEEQFRAFCKTFLLTEREQEVLSALLVSDENVQDIAVQLSISRAVLYRYIAKLNEKTQTKSRIGLIQFYYTWKDM